MYECECGFSGVFFLSGDEAALLGEQSDWARTGDAVAGRTSHDIYRLRQVRAFFRASSVLISGCSGCKGEVLALATRDAGKVWRGWETQAGRVPKLEYRRGASRRLVGSSVCAV